MRYFWFFLIPSFLFADTYIFRVQLDQTNPKSSIDSFFSTKGRKDESQPFYGTYVLIQPDTNYVLVKITPKDDSEEILIKNLYSLPNAVLWAQISIAGLGEPQFVIDNRAKFPVDTDYSVVVASK